MKKKEKSKIVLRIVCAALAALMIFSVVYTGIYYLIA